MIKVEIKKSNRTGKISSIEVKGHALSDVEGKDLVCAAVSSVITGGLNALNDTANFIFIHEKGHVLVQANSDASMNDNVVLTTIVTQLKTIEHKNSQFIQVKEILSD